jgi:hypothetical protein
VNFSPKVKIKISPLVKTRSLKRFVLFSPYANYEIFVDFSISVTIGAEKIAVADRFCISVLKTCVTRTACVSLGQSQSWI